MKGAASMRRTCVKENIDGGRGRVWMTFSVPPFKCCIFQEVFQPLSALRRRSVVGPADSGNAKDTSEETRGLVCSFTPAHQHQWPQPTLLAVCLGYKTQEQNRHVFSFFFKGHLPQSLQWKNQVSEPVPTSPL